MNPPTLAVVRSTAPLSAAEARALTDRIRSTAEDLASLLHEAYERQAWRALGYDSWRAYAMEELDLSQSRAYQLLDLARVVAAIEEAAGTPVSTMVEIGERAARDLKPQLAAVTEEIRERVEAGEPPAEAVAAVVGEKRAECRERAAAAEAESDPFDDPELRELEEMLSISAGAGEAEEIRSDVAAAAAEAKPPEAEESQEDVAGFDLGAELKAAHAKIDALEAELDALTTDDTAAELRRQVERYARLEGRVQQMLTTEGELKRTAKYQGGVLKKVREVLGVERDRDILPRLLEVVQGAGR